MKEFKDKVAVVTGAASGIGRGIAERCAQEGMKVVLADIEEAALMKASNELRANGAETVALETDVSKADHVERLALETLDRFGVVHLLFNNAGVDTLSWIWKYTTSDWEWLLGVNLWGVIHGIRVFVPIMLEQDVDCHIVNTASLAGLMSYPSSGIYQVTKHAVVSLSETLYHELNQIDAKVHVSVLCPAGVRTRIAESGRNRPGGTVQTSTPSGSGHDDTELGKRFWQRIRAEALEPKQVADIVFKAIREVRFYILTHPEYNEAIRIRLEDILEGRNPTSAYTVL